MNWVRLSGDDGQVHDGATTGPRRGHKKSTTGFATGSRRVHDGLKPDAIIAVSAFADTKATSEGRSETGDPPSAGAAEIGAGQFAKRHKTGFLRDVPDDFAEPQRC